MCKVYAMNPSFLLKVYTVELTVIELLIYFFEKNENTISKNKS